MSYWREVYLKSSFKKKSSTFWLTIIVVIALGLRLFHLDHESLWVDEIASMNGSDPEQSWAWVIKYSISDQPPAFFLLLHGWFKIFPFTDFFGRLFAAFIGITGIIAIFFLGREVKNDKVGLTAATITTFSFIHIYFSQEVRFYTLVFLFSCLSYLFFIKAVKNPKVIHFLFYILFTSSVIYSHYFGLIVFAVQGIIFLAIITIYPLNVRFLSFSIGSAVLIIVIISPWIPIFFADAQMKDFWIEHESWYFLINYFYVYFKDILSCFIFGSLLIYYFVTVAKKTITEKGLVTTDLILIGSVFLSFLIPLLYSLIQTPLLQVRYTFIALPCLIVMISLGFDLINPRKSIMLLVICCCTAFLSLVIIEKHYSKIRKEDWRGMITAQILNTNPGEVLISPKAWYCNYYFKSRHSDLRSILPEQRDLGSVPEGIWWLDGFNLTANKTPQELKLMAEGYSEVKTKTFKDCRATYYRRDH